MTNTKLRKTEYGAYLIIEADAIHQDLFHEIFNNKRVMILPTGLGHGWNKSGDASAP